MIRTTSRPANSPASRVASRCTSLKKAGTVITALRTGWPRNCSARSFKRPRMMAEISCGAYSRSPSRDLDVFAHLALDRADGPLGGQDPLVAGRRADQHSALRVQTDDRRQNGLAVGADHLGPAVAYYGNLAVGRSQIDAYDRFHLLHSLNAHWFWFMVILLRRAEVHPALHSSNAYWFSLI